MQTRKTSRKTVSLPGRYFTGLGNPVDVTLIDLSTGGCRFAPGPGKFTPGTQLQVFVGSSGPHRAMIKWSDGGEIGVTFTVPLNSNLVDQSQDGHVPDLSKSMAPGDFEPMDGSRPSRFC
ncbi:PilZ domain-containing protein [Erythrobacter crassostreae]|uniref:PilZ domain-containing protein n=1 Tax=Erythrobacter crassostreae TaxID=2828328 RepID=A0A9X1JKD7_9SPHN|nr:PilZ domain-containing protein [Erythrobacter crassostrea]MBV7258851.1 PilZ domain-containing protein [Erythrobacter crassostrea]